MKYFAHVTSNVKHKNAAQRAIQKYALSVNKTLLKDDNALRDYIQDLRLQMENINEKNPRSHDIVYSATFYPDLDVRNIFFDSGFISVTFYPILREM